MIRRANRELSPPVQRVLMTADAMGGVWTYSIELAGSLAQQGVQVILATMGAALSDEQRNEAVRIPGLQLSESNFKLEWMDDPWADMARASEWLLDLEDRFRPDVVHLNGYCHGALPWRAPIVMVGHSCVLSWWMAVKGEPAPPCWNRYQREVARGLHAAAMVIAPSAAMLSVLERLYGLPRDGKVVPNGRAAARFNPVAKEPFVFSVGRVWDDAKNIALLDRIAPELEWPVYVAGDCRHPGGSARSLNKVRALGCLPTSTLAAWLARASIFALPARYEPFGLSTLEAALAGCALVLGDIPSLRENWDGVARFVPPNDARAWDHAITELIHDDASRSTLCASARIRALEFTPGRMAAGYLAAYREVLERASRSAQTLSLCIGSNLVR